MLDGVAAVEGVDRPFFWESGCRFARSDRVGMISREGLGIGVDSMTEGVTAPMADDEPAVSVQDRRASFALPGLLLAGGALICASVTLFILLGLTPIAPTTNVVIASAALNSLFILGLMYLIGREIVRLVRARNRGRAAARLHVRIVVLFSIVAITPAVLVAIFASLTLNVGLDRWFSLRTQSIVQSSQDVARAYMLENASYLQGQTVSMSNDLDATGRCSISTGPASWN